MAFVAKAQEKHSYDSSLTAPLFKTIRLGDAARLKALLEAKADPNAVLDGYSALMAAALNGSAEEMKLLLAYGAKVNDRNPDSLSALWFAVPDEEKMDLLLQHGADATLRSREGNTVLVKLAMVPGTAGLMQKLVDKGCDPRSSSRTNDALYNAAMAGDTATIALLLRYGVGVNDTAAVGDYPVNAAMNYRCFDALKMLVEHGADVNVSPGSAVLPLMIGITPLMWAAISNDKPSLLYLLEHGADPNARSPRGYTPLMFLAMASRDDPDMTIALIKHGADPKVEAPDVTDALFYARQKGNTPSVDILSRHALQKQ